MKVNAVKQRLAAGQPVVGINAALGSSEAAGFLARAGFDLILVDNQHGNWDDTTSLQAFQRITLEGCTPFTRVRKNDFYAIGRMLDRGALGVVVPFVNSVEDAQAAAFAMRYPPRGGRSYGFTLAEYHGAGYGEWPMTRCTSAYRSSRHRQWPAPRKSWQWRGSTAAGSGRPIWRRRWAHNAARRRTRQPS